MSDWYVLINGKQHGPMTEKTLRDMGSSGKISPTDLIWTDGMAEWAEASKFNGIATNSLPKRNPPPPPISPKNSVLVLAEDKLDSIQAKSEAAIGTAFVVVVIWTVLASLVNFGMVAAIFLSSTGSYYPRDAGAMLVTGVFFGTFVEAFALIPLAAVWIASSKIKRK